MGTYEDGVLASMAAPVIVVDAEGRVSRLNRAAGALLDVAPMAARGKPVEEVVGPEELAALIRDSLSSGMDRLEQDVILDGPPEVHLLVHGSPLLDENEARVGMVLVLGDVTRLRRLENIRSDFVSNVSHELKTPITSIKGFVETLRDGALEDQEHARQFLDIIGSQTDRLAAIIEDLLSLSRLEDESGGGRIALVRQPIRPVLQGAILLCQPQVRERGGTVELSCPEDLEAACDSALLELAVVNLVDNALKYGGVTPSVHVYGALERVGVVIRVQDSGVGIPLEHQPRVFERFYRVDKARSRRDGGTGLGLALVKHIALAHRGRVRLKSAPGVGSTFTLRLMRSPAKSSSDPK